MIATLECAARGRRDGRIAMTRSLGRSTWIDALFASADSVLILVGHSAIDYPRVLDRSSFVFDAVNATAGTARPNLVRL